MNNKQIQSRRDWLRNALRWAAITVIGIASAVLLRRRNDGCVKLVACDRCRELGRCNLPPAVQWEQQRKERA